MAQLVTLAGGVLLLLHGACGPTVASTAQNRELAQKKYELGNDYFYKRMYEPAMAEALKAIELDPKNADARNLVGALLLQKGVGQIQFIERDQCIRGAAASMLRKEADARLKEAEVQFRSALEARPGDPRALHNLAVVKMHFKDYDSVIALENKALESALYPDKHLSRGELGWAYYHRHDYVKALKELLEAVQIQPRYCVGHYRLAQVYYALGEKSDNPDEEYSNALDALAKVDAKACRIQEAQYLKGLALIKKRESTKADQPFDECIKMAPHSCLAAECQRYRRMVASPTAAP
jgi:tetratricopeptide (TPR) repeat protein